MKIKFKPRRLILIIILLIIIVIIISSFFKTTSNNHYFNSLSIDRYEEVISSIYEEDTYSNKNVEWSNNHINVVNNFNRDILVDDVIISPNSTAKLISEVDNEYGQIVSDYYNNFINQPVNNIIKMETDAFIEFEVQIEQSGLYALEFDYYDLDNSILPNEISLFVNDVYPYYESRVIKIYSQWKLTKEEFLIDRYQNEILPSSNKIRNWVNYTINDSTKFHRGDLKLYLEDGDKIKIASNMGSFFIGNITLKTPQAILSYQEYLELHNANLNNNYYEIAAESLLLRNDPSIRLRAERDPSATSYHSQFLRLNTIDGASWRNGGQEVTYQVEVGEAGFYQLSFKYLQNVLKNMPQFREIKINGEIPYLELAAYPFPYTRNWVNRTLVDENNEELLVYLNAGINTITMTNVIYPYRNVIESLRLLMNEITSLSLEIKKITGNSSDQYRDWDIELYIPYAKDKLISWANELESIHQELLVLSTVKKPAELTNLLSSANTLINLSEDVNQLPSKLVKLSEGDSSVLQRLGDLVQRLMNSNTEIQKVMVHGDVKLPKPYANIFVRFFEGFKRLVLSFVNNPYKATKTQAGELIVWVNHPRQYIEIMQTLIDSEYHGPLKVTLSQMPDENKLILANATNRAPDVAIGVNHWIPYDFAIRGAALNLRQFDGYEELVSKFSKGVMIPYAFEEGVYGIPETQNFWVTYYRKDILSSIGINEVPNTWDEIIEILPQLQRYGMNYFSPISMYEGFKPFVATLPFIYQFGGDLYTEDGMQTAINSEKTLEGIKLMAELFTLYNMPERVPNFYNHFRYGLIPIGISDLSTYLLLTTASPELQGLWDIALHPGVKNINEEGEEEIVRYAAAGAQSSMIFSSTAYQNEAWDFLNWWMSTETQVQYAYNLQTTYGQIYFWNTANLEAFEQLPLPNKHKQVILEQWEQAIEASRIPGYYMVEREISNAWNKIVFNGINPRLALDEAVRVSNREIIYKMEEFNYAKNGVKIKDYKVPSIYTIDYWLKEDNHD